MRLSPRLPFIRSPTEVHVISLVPPLLYGPVEVIHNCWKTGCHMPIAYVAGPETSSLTVELSRRPRREWLGSSEQKGALCAFVS